MADFRVFFEVYCDHRDLHVLTHSCPTRRSSDLRGHRPQRSLAVPQYPGALEQIRVGWNRQRRSTDPVNLLYPFEVDRIIVRGNRTAVPPDNHPIDTCTFVSPESVPRAWIAGRTRSDADWHRSYERRVGTDRMNAG